MAKKTQTKKPARSKAPPIQARREPSGVTNPLAEVDDGLLKNYQRNSNDLIYEMVMRGGGEPFGAPYEIGVSSLTERIVRFFRQRSFFNFETLEQPRQRKRTNKFTRYGASPYRGAYGRKKSS